MTEQKAPHTQSQQNTIPGQTDFEAGQHKQEAARGSAAAPYENMAGAETGGNAHAQEEPRYTGPAQYRGG